MALAETTGASGLRVTMQATVRGETRHVTWEDGRLTGDQELIARAERMAGGTIDDAIVAVDAVRQAVGGSIILHTEQI